MARKTTFGYRLKCARIQNDLTQAGLSAMTGLSCSWISDFECGRRLPSVPVLICLCNALNVSADVLLNIKRKPIIIDAFGNVKVRKHVKRRI